MIWTTAGEARASSHSRAAASPGTEGRAITATARTRNAPAPASATPSRLFRRRELGATTAIIANEPQHARAATLIERHPTVAVGPFVAGLARADHADRASDLLVLRLDVEEPLIGAIVQDRQDERRVPQGAGHPAAPRPRDTLGVVDRPRGRQARAAGQQRGQDEEQRGTGTGHQTSHRVYQGRPIRPAMPQSATRVTPKTHTIVAPVGRSRPADATTPSTLTPAPNAQPTSSRVPIDPPRIVAARAGTMR